MTLAEQVAGKGKKWNGDQDRDFGNPEYLHRYHHQVDVRAREPDQCTGRDNRKQRRAEDREHNQCYTNENHSSSSLATLIFMCLMAKRR